MIQFKDFLPEVVKNVGKPSGDNFETLAQVMDRINNWDAENTTIQIIRVETVILPGVRDQRTDVNEMRIMEGGSITWTQFFRVWFKVQIP